MAKCVVTGGLGFIGSHVVDALIEEGHEVYIIDDLSTGSLDNLNPKAHINIGDIADPRQYPAKAEYVFHLAALARIQPSILNPVESHNVNVDGTLGVLEYCRSVKAKIIFSSSSSIYEGHDLPTHELSRKSPKSPYALQKLICEQYIRLYRELYGLDYTILRYFNVFGERQITEGSYAAVVGIFLNQRSEGKKLTITGDGEQRRDFTYVKDVARANLMGMDWHGTFNIGTGNNCSITDVADMVQESRQYLPQREGEVQATLADNTKATLAGWRPSVTIKEWADANIQSEF